MRAFLARCADIGPHNRPLRLEDQLKAREDPLLKGNIDVVRVAVVKDNLVELLLEVRRGEEEVGAIGAGAAAAENTPELRDDILSNVAARKGLLR
jgi:hypothetical protein